jgi:hypothetical protein
VLMQLEHNTRHRINNRFIAFIFKLYSILTKDNDIEHKLKYFHLK